MKHFYPQHFSDEIRQHWGAVPDGAWERCKKLPAREILQDLISICYQVSMMSEELRLQRFRVAICDPSDFPPELGPPYGFFRVVFKEPRAFHEYELLKLSPASEFESSLIGVRQGPAGDLQMWGLINSGTRWTQVFQGGSKPVIPMPDSLVLDITGPGSLRAYRGSHILAQLSAGRITMPTMNVLRSRWLKHRMNEFECETMAMHARNRAAAKEPWAIVHEDFLSRLYTQVVKRIISSIRMMKHGGTIIVFPRSLVEEVTSPNPYVFIKNVFQDEEAVRRLRQLTIGIMNELARHCGDSGAPGKTVGWREYVEASSKTLLELDESVFEFARFVANLAAVDGAVVVTKSLDLVGFGGVIKGTFGKEDVIARARDAEADQRVHERPEGVGTRHLSAYYLCKVLPEALAIVISQDGNAKLVRWMDGFVTYWDFLPMSIEDEKPF